VYLEAFEAGLTPDPLQTVDQWADQHVMLPSFVDGTVHFKPDLITNPNAIGENGRTVALKPLEWLIGETNKW